MACWQPISLPLSLEEQLQKQSAASIYYKQEQNTQDQLKEIRWRGYCEHTPTHASVYAHEYIQDIVQVHCAHVCLCINLTSKYFSSEQHPLLVWLDMKRPTCYRMIAFMILHQTNIEKTPVLLKWSFPFMPYDFKSEFLSFTISNYLLMRNQSLTNS